MAGDREWFCVELPGGRKLPDGDPTEFPNKEMANALAKEEAINYSRPLTVVKYTRKEIKTIERVISIKETDVGTVSAT